MAGKRIASDKLDLLVNAKDTIALGAQTLAGVIDWASNTTVPSDTESESPEEDAAETEEEPSDNQDQSVPKAWDAAKRDKLKNGEIEGAFAGPDMSFPIASAADVSDAWGLAGHAENPDSVRKAIVRIAIKYGWQSGLPESAVKWAEENHISMKYGDMIDSSTINFHTSLKVFGDPNDPNTLLIEGYASTAATDRTGDSIDPPAFQAGLEAYMRNPIVLFNHDIHKPVGKVLSAVVDSVGLKVKVAIDRTLEWGNRVADMVNKRILNAFSIRARNDVAHGWVDATGVRRIVNWDLQEVSVVTVPANQQALFSIAKALSDGNDLVARSVPNNLNGGKMDTNEQAREATVPQTAAIDLDALVEATVKRLEAKAKADQEQKDAANKATKEIEDRIRAELEAKYAAKSQEAQGAKPVFPVADANTGTRGANDEAEFRRTWNQIQVMSKYDRMGDTDLLLKLHTQRYAATVGRSAPPSEQLYRAAMVRAAKFMRTTDRIPVMGRNGPEYREVPAFDAEAIRPISSNETYDAVDAAGKTIARDVPFRDNVTNEGMKQLIEIGAKSNELAYSTYSGYGDQWVPTLMAASLWRTIRLEAAVLPLFSQFDMPSNPYDYPTEGADPTFYLVGESTDESQLVPTGGPFTDSKVGTGKVTFTANKLGALSYWSEEFGEDSVIPVDPQYRDQFAIKMAHTLDELLISGHELGGGSSSNISYYGSAYSAPGRFLVLDGLRAQPLVTTTSDARDAGTLTIDDINATRALMGTNGVFAADPKQLVILCDVPTKLKFEDLGEVLTVDKYGPQAVVLNGQLGSVKGIAIVASQDYSLTDSSGYINATGASNTKGSFMVVNRNMVRVGWKRRPRILVGQVPYSDAFYILATARLDVGFFAAGSVGLSYNVTV